MAKKPKLKAASPPSVVEQTADEVRGILWQIASDSEQSGTARVSACRILLHDARERDGGETRHEIDLNKRAASLLRQVAN